MFKILFFNDIFTSMGQKTRSRIAFLIVLVMLFKISGITDDSPFTMCFRDLAKLNLPMVVRF